MTDEFWARLADRQLPTSTVPLPVEGGTVEVVLRALPPAQWEALCAAHPATGEAAHPGDVDTLAMRPALLAASVVAPDGAPPRDPAWWDNLAKGGGVTSGELDALTSAAWNLNRAAPPYNPHVGKD
jgi:hypothetical protein